MVDQPGLESRTRGGMTITDIDIPFGRMVSILIKWIFAVIVAYFVVMLIFAVIGGLILFGTGWIVGDWEQFLRQWMPR